MAFTGVPDVDIGILLSVPDEDLSEVCSINRYVADLCSSDEHWRRRLERFGYSPEDLPGIPLRDFYRFAVLEANTSIGKILGLPLDEEYIRIMAIQGNILPGAEKYLGIDKALAGAFKEEGSYGPEERSLDTIEYLIGVCKTLFNESAGKYRLPSLDRSIAAAIDFNDDSYIEDLFSLQKVWKANNTIDFVLKDTARAMGKNLRRDLFDRYKSLIYYDLVPNNRPQDSGVNLLYRAYLVGIVEGSLKNPDRYYDEFSSIAPSLFRRVKVQYFFLDVVNEMMPLLLRDEMDPRFLEWLLEHPKKNNRDVYRIMALEALKEGKLELGAEYEDFLEPRDIYAALAKSAPDLAIEYYKGNRKEIKGVLALQTSNLDFIHQYFQKNLKGDRYIAPSVISNIIDLNKISPEDLRKLIESDLIVPSFLERNLLLLSTKRRDLIELIIPNEKFILGEHTFSLLSIDDDRDITVYILMIMQERGYPISGILIQLSRHSEWHRFVEIVGDGDLRDVDISAALELV